MTERQYLNHLLQWCNHMVSIATQQKPEDPWRVGFYQGNQGAYSEVAAAIGRRMEELDSEMVAP